MYLSSSDESLQKEMGLDFTDENLDHVLPVILFQTEFNHQ